MLYYLQFLTKVFGPFRLFGSYLMLLCLGALSASLVAGLGIRSLKRILPLDRGKRVVTATNKVEAVPGGDVSKGKRTGGGLLLFLLAVPLLALVLPPVAGVGYQWAIIGCLLLEMLTGYLDDRSVVEWSAMRKGLLDLVIAVLTASIMASSGANNVWLPVTKRVFAVPFALYVPCATALLWMMINSTNCSDGVDGLAGTLSLMALFAMTVFLYGVVGHVVIAKYLLVPYSEAAVRWAIVTATFAGGVAGYLWHNAEPSSVLMGDAGSRPLGLLLGVSVLASGNPFFALVVALILLCNGGGGLLKLGLLRTLRKLGFDTRRDADITEANPDHRPGLVRFLHRYRLPLHDHCRKNLHWSNAQVLMRFVLLQAFLMPILFLILIKLR